MKRRTGFGASAAATVLALAVVVAGLVAPAGAAHSVSGPEAAAAASAKMKLGVKRASVGCECGGAGYLWGWNALALELKGTRKGHSYRARINGKAVGLRTDHASYGTIIQVNRDAKPKLAPGKKYKIRIVEFKKNKKTRTSKAFAYRVPKPVVHPKRGRLETPKIGDEHVLVAGEAAPFKFKGKWGAKARFASGVDYFYQGDDWGGAINDRKYPLTWATGTKKPVKLVPTEAHIGQKWHVLVVGYKPAAKANKKRGIKKGAPVPGSEWGFSWFLRVVSPDEPGLTY